MLYYYANSGHKIGLERVRRGVALLKKIEKMGMDAVLLVNDFRAGLVAKDLGLKNYVTIEGVQDIDAIAKTGDSIIIDTPEDDNGRIEKFCLDFKNVWKFTNKYDDVPSHSEILLDPNHSIMIDDIYFDKSKKREDRVLFVLGDADYGKVILSNSQFFDSFEMELYLGNYFFVKYEDELAKHFKKLHEPEDYADFLATSSYIVTSSTQTALEAKASDTKVIFLNLSMDSIYPISVIKDNNIPIVDGFDIDSLKNALKLYDNDKVNSLEKLDITFLTSKL